MVSLKVREDLDGNCRREIRVPVSWTGRLVTAWQRYGVPVEVSDLSLFGARIRLEPTAKLPLTFELWLDDRGTVHPCRIAWRRGGEIGVEFTGHPTRASTKVQIALAQAAQCSAADGT